MKKNQLFYDSEKQLYGTTHQEIGGVIAKEWNLPEDLHYAVAYHHTPSKSRDHYEITAIVHCTD
jgi:HD-like signal output (HDOD) protein